MTTKLHTAKEVHSMLGFEGSKELSIAALETLIRASNCFREFGSLLRMTDQDIADFLKWTSARSGPDAEPSDTDVGQLVAIGDPLERDGIVYVNWTRRGKEMDELRAVEVGNPEPCKILAVWDATYGEYKAQSAQWLASKWRYGKSGKWWRSQVREAIKEKMEADE